MTENPDEFDTVIARPLSGLQLLQQRATRKGTD